MLSRVMHVAGLIAALATALPQVVRADPPGAGWTLVWNDDFDAPPGSLPDPRRWAPCPPRSCGPPSGRLSHYAMQEGLLDHFDGRDLELYVADCSKHPGDPVCIAGVPYASGAIRSTQSFRYGYAEIKWNLTFLSGEHPTFWLLPAEGGPAFEIDVAEFAGDDPFTVHMGVHCDNERKHERRSLRDGTNWGDSNFERTTSVSSPKATQVSRLPNGTRRSRDGSRIPKRPARTQFDPRKREPFPHAASCDSSPRADACAGSSLRTSARR
jgi:hypothetical protein